MLNERYKRYYNPNIYYNEPVNQEYAFADGTYDNGAKDKSKAEQNDKSYIDILEKLYLLSEKLKKET